MDADGNGSLEADEIGENQKRAVQQLRRAADSNSDGIVTRDEFATGLKDKNVSVNAAAGSAAIEARIQFLAQLRRFDRDGDGRITGHEVRQALRAR